MTHSKRFYCSFEHELAVITMVVVAIEEHDHKRHNLTGMIRIFYDPTSLTSALLR